jgi:hypothetical protein
MNNDPKKTFDIKLGRFSHAFTQASKKDNLGCFQESPNKSSNGSISNIGIGIFAQDVFQGSKSIQIRAMPSEAKKQPAAS